MAEFKIDGRMKVKTLKENFNKEFGGILHVKHGNKLADDDATLAAIRSNDEAKGGTLTCRASRTVGKFEKELWDVFGIKVNVFTGDDWVAVLDGITLNKIKDIPNQATKDKMEEFVAYKRNKTADTCCETGNDSNWEKLETSVDSNDVRNMDEYKAFVKAHPKMPLVFGQFNKLEFPLTIENLESHSDEFNGIWGAVWVTNGDEEIYRVIGVGDVIDYLYEAIEIAEEDEFDITSEETRVNYLTVFNCFGGKFDKMATPKGLFVNQTDDAMTLLIEALSRHIGARCSGYPTTPDNYCIYFANKNTEMFDMYGWMGDDWWMWEDEYPEEAMALALALKKKLIEAL